MSNVKCPISNVERFRTLDIGHWALVIALGLKALRPRVSPGLPLSIAKDVDVAHPAQRGECTFRQPSHPESEMSNASISNVQLGIGHLPLVIPARACGFASRP